MTSPKIINVETRIENSLRRHFNHPGDWRPRLIIWPTGEPDEVYHEDWGFILAGTIKDYSEANILVEVPFRRTRHFGRRWHERLWLTLLDTVPHWTVDEACAITPQYVETRAGWGHDQVVHLFTAERPSVSELRDIQYQETLDRATLLPRGKAILELGTEEAVAEICFSETTEAFVDALSRQALTREFQVDLSPEPFLSGWIRANAARVEREYGRLWNVF